MGIIASVIWVPCAGICTYESEFERASGFIASTEFTCRSGQIDLSAGIVGTPDRDAAQNAGTNPSGTTVPIPPGAHVDDLCYKRADESLMSARRHGRMEAAFVALVPVPLAWGFTYLVLFLGRWVRRGFIRSNI
jgi:hypothetical protein